MSWGFSTPGAAAVGTAVPTGLRAEFDTAIARFSAYQREQGGSTRAALGLSASQDQLRADVYERILKPIATIVRRTLPNAPEVQQLVVPSRSLRADSLVEKASEAASAAAN